MTQEKLELLGTYKGLELSLETAKEALKEQFSPHLEEVLKYTKAVVTELSREELNPILLGVALTELEIASKKLEV